MSSQNQNHIFGPIAISLALQRFYVTYLGRPADPIGIDYWVNSGLTEEQLADAISQTSEYALAVDSQGLADIINQFYQSLFNRDVDDAGLNFWTEQISSGSLTPLQAGDHIGSAALNGPDNSDKLAIESKLLAANAFTDVLKREGSDSYKGAEAILTAVEFLRSVFTRDTVPSISDVLEVIRGLVAINQTLSQDPEATSGGGGGGHHGGFIPQASDFALSVYTDLVDSNGFSRINPMSNILLELGGYFRLDSASQVVIGSAETFSVNDKLVDSSGADLDSFTLTGVVDYVPGATVTNIETVNIIGMWTSDTTLFTQGKITGGDLFDIDGTIATHGTASIDLTINATGSGFSHIDVADITAAGGLAAAPITVITADPTVGTTIIGSALADTIVGSGLADDINGGGASDSINGEAGDDIFRYTEAEFVDAENLNGGADMDTVVFSSAISFVDGAFANKSNLEAITLANFGNMLALGANAAAATSSLTVTGGSNTDIISAALLGEAITINGGDGNDSLTGSNQADTINAGLGPDFVNAGLGNDAINLTETTPAVDTVRHAGSGANDYDTITGFTATNAVDRISVTANAAKLVVMR